MEHDGLNFDDTRKTIGVYEAKQKYILSSIRIVESVTG